MGHVRSEALPQPSIGRARGASCNMEYTDEKQEGLFPPPGGHEVAGAALPVKSLSYRGKLKGPERVFRKASTCESSAFDNRRCSISSLLLCR